MRDMSTTKEVGRLIGADSLLVAEKACIYAGNIPAILGLAIVGTF
jgi:hypothetical protein